MFKNDQGLHIHLKPDIYTQCTERHNIFSLCLILNQTKPFLYQVRITKTISVHNIPERTFAVIPFFQF